VGKQEIVENFDGGKSMWKDENDMSVMNYYAGSSGGES
jgi:hypothetical protein